MKKRLILVIFLIIIAIASVVGVTYAIYTWAMSEEISGTADCLKVNYIGGQDIGGDGNYRMLSPSENYIGGLTSAVIVSLDSSCAILSGTGTLYLNTDNATSEALLTSGVLKYEIIENSIISVGSGIVSSTGPMVIYENFNVNTTPRQYTVYVWLDKSMINDSNSDAILTSSYLGSISMSVESGDE